MTIGAFNYDLLLIVAIRLRSILSLRDSSFGPMIARISSSSREWFNAESKLPADALRIEDESSGDLLRKETLSRLDAKKLSDSSSNCWVLVLLFGGKGGGVPDELFSSEKHTFVLRTNYINLLIFINIINYRLIVDRKRRSNLPVGKRRFRRWTGIP